MTAVLQRPPPAPDDPKRVLRGRVLDETGQPVAGALISADAVRGHDGSETFGAIEGLDRNAIADGDGRFRICCAEPAKEIGIDVRAPGWAPRLSWLATGGEVREIRLDRGATVSGRLVKGDAGVAGVVVGLVQTNRAAGVFMGEFTIGTDGEGRFTFSNVPRGHEYAVYGKMASVHEHGATEVRVLRVDASSIDAGVLPVGAGHCVSGRVVTTDGKPIPDSIRLLLSADVAWDSQLGVLDPEGCFSFSGVPSGLYSLSLRVPGYRLSARNVSRRPTWPTSLEGRIDGDALDLLLELEPGAIERPQWTQELMMREQALKSQPVGGVPNEGR